MNVSKSNTQAATDTQESSTPGPGAGASRPSELKIRLLLICFGLAGAVGFFELAFRLFSPMLQPPKWRDLPVTYYMPEAANPVGDFQYSAVKPPNTFRIVVIGDSFTHGGTLQMFQTFPKLLERYLNLNIHQPRVEVVNYSKPGVATVHELKMVKTALESFDPDLVLLEITLNDPEPRPYHATHRFQDENGQIVLRNPIFRVWKSLGFLVHRLYATRANAEYIDYFKGIFSDKNNWSGFAGSLQEMKALSGQHNVKFAAMIFPLFSFPFNEHYPFQDLHDKIHRALDGDGIPYLDLFESYRNIPAERLQAIPYDNPHPNEIANRIAADQLVGWIDREKLVPAEVIPKNTGTDRPQLKSLHLSLEKEMNEVKTEIDPQSSAAVNQ